MRGERFKVIQCNGFGLSIVARFQSIPPWVQKGL
jgi:hypothetical protein